MSDHDSAGTPAQRFITRFGVGRLADWTGRHPSRVRAWTWPVERGGTGGAIPLKVRAAVIAGAARDFDVVLTYGEFEPQPGEGYLQVGAAPDGLRLARAH